jgi:DMSO/TMAO reductase YedYZ molybdopterin-dependent catalytic subunit
MSKKTRKIQRRTFMKGLVSSTAAALAGCGQTEPPTYGHILRMGDWLTYKSHRLLLPDTSLAREYELSDISPAPAIGTTNPADPDKGGVHPEYAPEYAAYLKDEFASYGLRVEGLVARPGMYSLAALKRMPARTQITRHACEEGWSAIAQWTGVPLKAVLEAAGILPNARYVQFHAFDGWGDGLDMIDALHPQTILAYGMNGRDLPIPHGAPIRLRVERQIGYKNMKFIRSIVVTEQFEDHGQFGSIQNGWSWYVGV